MVSSGFISDIISGFLDVSGGHSIYYEIHGNRNGPKAVILHGGPGGGSHRSMLHIYDLSKWCVLIFDQRGCGKSKPFLELRHNTTWDLVEDIEALRCMIGVEKWFVSGGSWGTTLALVYAQKYPMRVTGLLLRGLCFCDNNSFRWLYEEGGASEVYPEIWEKYIAVLPVKLRKAGWMQIARYFNKGLKGSHKMRFANAWWKWEAAVSHLVQIPDTANASETLALAILENHYFVNSCWLKDYEILRGLHRLRHIPITIVHGRYDMVCPVSAVHQFKKALPHTNVIITLAGHAGMEKETVHGLKQSTLKALKFNRKTKSTCTRTHKKK